VPVSYAARARAEKVNVRLLLGEFSAPFRPYILIIGGAAGRMRPDMRSWAATNAPHGPAVNAAHGQ